MRQVQGHCEYVDRNAKLDDGRAKCGEVHQQFRLKDMMDDRWERRALPAPDAQGRTEYFINHHDRTTHWSPPYTPPAADARELFDIHVP